LKDMTKKIIIGILSFSIPLTLLSCSLDKNPLGQISLNSNKTIKGKVEFPESKFEVKAILGDISTNATVSVIYPPDHPTTPNKTIATGLTNATGNFTINTDPSFTPATGDVFILEAVKRIGRTNRDVLTISSYLQWNGTTYVGMTTPSIYINSKTTALSIIASHNTDILNAKETIGKIDVSSGSGIPLNIPNNKMYFTSDGDTDNDIYSIDTDGQNPLNITNNSDNDSYVSLSPDSKKLAFVSDRDGNNEIYVMNVNGTNIVRLTNDAGSDTTPEWSPDGTKIAFASDRDSDNEIYVMDEWGNNLTKLTDNTNNDNYPSWSPDGTKITFASDRDTNNEIYVMNVNGTSQTNLSNNANNDNYPSWSPNGTKIAFVSNRDTNNEIYVMDTNGTNQTNLTNNPANDSFPKWIEDVSSIAFASDRDGNVDNEIYTVDLSGNVQQITDNIPGYFTLTNIPTKIKASDVLKVSSMVDKVLERNYDPAQYITLKNRQYIIEDPMQVGLLKKIIFSSSNNLYTMNEDGTSQVTLLSTALNENNPVWSPDGLRVAFDGDDEIYVIDSNIRMLTNSIGFDNNNPAWSPSGKKIAFVSTRDSNNEIYVMDEWGNNQVRLTNNTFIDINPTWSPDGNKIVFVSNRDGTKQLYTMNEDGTNQTRLLTSTYNDSMPTWSIDGKKIAFVSDRDGNNEIYTINSDGTNLTRITSNANSDTEPCWSPNGTKITFVSDRESTTNKIFIMDADGTNQTKLFDTQSSAPDWK